MPINRRQFVASTATAASVPILGLAGSAASAAEVSRERDGPGTFRIAPFRFDATPPIGHSCCGGWIKNVEVVDDPLEALGFVLLGAGKPLVVCAVDWCALANAAHLQWRMALAEAANTTPDRVAVQCVHQHNAPLACIGSEELVASQGDLPHILDLSFFSRLLDEGSRAVAQAVRSARPCTHVATGQARVEQVASNRRIARDAQGRIMRMRGSSCEDSELIALPEGTIDPLLRTVAFYDGSEKVAACHFYATHPMSYYGDGRVTADFAGLARRRRQQEEPGCLHVYFTGCAGDVSAGKYNDGSPEARAALTQRLYDGIAASERALVPEPIERVAWRTAEILPVAREALDKANLERIISDREDTVVHRNRGSYMLTWLRRLEARQPLLLTALAVNHVTLLHLPAECFVEYQLRAQALAPDRFVATAAYGDGGPWYIPVKEEYPAGGYEIGVTFSGPSIDDLLTTAMRQLLV